MWENVYDTSDFNSLTPSPIFLYLLVPSCHQFLPYPSSSCPGSNDSPADSLPSSAPLWSLLSGKSSGLDEPDYLPVGFALMIYSAASELLSRLPTCLFYLTPRSMPPPLFPASYPPAVLDIFAILHAVDHSWPRLPFRDPLLLACVTPPSPGSPFPILTDPFSLPCQFFHLPGWFCLTSEWGVLKV